MWALFINVFGKAVQFLGLILLFFFLNQSYCGSPVYSLLALDQEARGMGIYLL